MDVNNGQQAAETGGTETTQETELSLREELAKNLADLKGDPVDTPVDTPVEKTAPAAKTDTTQTGDTTQTTSTETTQTTPTDAKSKAPQSWSAADRAHWDKIPAEVQAVIARREEEAHRGITSMGQDAAFGRKVNEVVSPYLPMIRAEGGDPVGAVQSLLQTAYTLRAGNPEQKVQMFQHLAQQFGVDLQAVQAGAQQVDPQVASLRQELAQLRGHLQQGEQQQHQQVQAHAQQLIEAFAADPKNEFYGQVAPMMGQLILSGQASDMQDAYDKACWAMPDVRSTILTRQTADAEAKRAAEAKARADAKRRAAGSISGSPGAPVSTTTTAANQNLSLRDELRANLRAATSS